jgi:hypothetical protein
MGAKPSAFLPFCMTIWAAAPLRPDSRVPRLSPYPRACVPGYSRGGRVAALVEPAFAAQAHHFLDEERLLPGVEAGE